MEVVELFPTPMMIVNIESELDMREITKLKLLTLNKKNLIANGHNGNFFHNNSELLKSYLKDSSLEKTIQKYLNIFLKEVWLEKDSTIKITGSWINLNPPNSIHHEHFHTNSILSGVLYIDTEKNCGDFQTHRPKTNSRQISGFAYGKNKFVEQIRDFTPKKYDLYIFPSTLQHSVLPNKSNKIRISFSFNSFYQGEIMMNPKNQNEITSLTRLVIGDLG
jgi:uncharacterized protein (TIGR02466 family)